MAVLFKQPLFRRMFAEASVHSVRENALQFGATLLLWLYVLLVILMPGGSEPIHY